MLRVLRHLYHRAISHERRMMVHRWIHAEGFRSLRSAVRPSAKGTFSLRRCDELRTIFVHTPKAAGTSIALSIFGELPYHHTVQDYYVIFGRSTFDEYFTFTFVRNPWDRVFSAYNYLTKGGWDEKDKAWSERHLSKYRDFGDFVRRGLARREVQRFMHFRPQHEFVCDRRGAVAVNFVGYFESVGHDFRKICDHIGIEATLAHVNESSTRDYRMAYDDDTRAVVAGIYERDIHLFGYSFDGIISRFVP